MTCVEFKELAPLLAIGALDPAERVAAEAHLAHQPLHAGCATALQEALAAAQLLSDELPPAPLTAAQAEALWPAIEARLTDAYRATARRSGAGRSRRAAAWALAASIAAIALLLGQQLGQNRQRREDARALAELAAKGADVEMVATRATAKASGELEGCRRELNSARGQLDAQQRALSLLGDAATELVALREADGARAAPSVPAARVLFNGHRHQAVVVAGGLPPAADKDYELWVIRGKDKIAAGLFQLPASGPSLLAVDEKLLAGGVDVFAITLEPAGGGPVPRGSLVLAGTVKKKG